MDSFTNIKRAFSTNVERFMPEKSFCYHWMHKYREEIERLEQENRELRKSLDECESKK